MKWRWLSIPYVIWMAIFVVIPVILIVLYALTNEYGQFTASGFMNMYQYVGIFTRSFSLALISTIICLIIGYPLAYILAREISSLRSISMLLVMLPMWMNFLLRTYAWMSILENNGFINRFFSAVGIFTLVNSINGLINSVFGTALQTDITYVQMINTQGAIVLGMVYNYLPFMILPIFSVIERIDKSVVEAAQDLGGNTYTVFRRVIFPLSLPGILSGITMVFVPSVSTFAISKMLGGGGSILLGDLIEMQFFGNAYNPHLGSAISLVMMVVVMICMAVMNRFGEGEEEVVML